MGRIIGLNVKLSSLNYKYKPGQIVSGTVEFELDSRIEVSAIRLRFNGSTTVHWSEKIYVKKEEEKESQNKEFKRSTSISSNEEEYKKLTIVNHDACEEWFDSYINLINNSDGYITAGRHSYSFQFILPKSLPASFKHEYGSHSYFIEVSIKHNLDEIEFVKKDFIVESDLDLNSDPSLKLAYGNTAKKEFCCDILQCIKEPVLANFSVEKSGYTPGEIITFNVFIDNKNRRAIKYATVSLYKNMKFKTQTQTQKETKEICTINLDRIVQPRSTEKWYKQKLVIPSSCKPMSAKSKIIEIKYELLLKFGSGGFTTAMYCPIPMVIGAVPFDVIAQEISDCSAEIGSDEPPTYEEALRQVPTAPPEEDGWVDKLAFWR